MKRRSGLFLGVVCLASALSLGGCDYGSSTTDLPLPGRHTDKLESQITRKPAAPTATGGSTEPIGEQERQTILDSVIRLIETAATTPGGDNFQIAIDNLNHYFEQIKDAGGFEMSPEAREFLLKSLPESKVKEFEARIFEKRDGRHIEDCLLYHRIATRVAGQGDDLSRVLAIFEWVVAQVQLVPPGSLAPPGMPQAQARPFDVLLRGMATEPGGEWSERAWLFMALCRQLGIDVGLVKYTPSGRNASEALIWICAVAIGDQAYLFDTRIGMPVPGPGGTGVATLEEAATTPRVLDQLDLPGQSPYRTTHADLSADKLSILIDSSPGYFSPRMRLFQESLAGRNRMILFRDPAVQRDSFAHALGARFGGVELWKLPIEVDFRLFNDARFVTATQFPIQFFHPALPLLSARLDELRGEIDLAKQKYVSFRFASDVTMSDPKKTPVPPQVRHILDLYATYYLALCQLDQKNTKQAEHLLKQTLELLPEPRVGDLYNLTYMFRWGAQTNLGRLFEAKGDDRRAIAYYCELDPTTQYHGNMLRARDLVWRDPTAPLPEPLPPPPQGRPAARQTASANATTQ